MFTLTAVPNPLYTEGSRVSRMRTVMTCVCGSSDVRKSYTTYNGEVDGQIVTCNNCGTSETF